MLLERDAAGIVVAVSRGLLLPFQLLQPMNWPDTDLAEQVVVRAGLGSQGQVTAQAHFTETTSQADRGTTLEIEARSIAVVTEDFAFQVGNQPSGRHPGLRRHGSPDGWCRCRWCQCHHAGHRLPAALGNAVG